MKENKMTYQLNPLIEAQKGFDVMATRLFYLGLQDINPHITQNDRFYDEEFPDTVIPPSELAKIFGHTQYLTEIDRATDKLIGRYISIKMDGGFDKYTIFQHIKYKPEKGLFIKFNEDMRPFILDIYKSYKKYGFTKIEMQQIFVLGSAYAMRLLELLLQYRSKAANGIIERIIDIDDLRTMLNVPPDAYKRRIGNFKQKVLDSPIQDINKNTQYYVSYETIKKGRSVCGFKFFCNCNRVSSDSDYTETIDSQQGTEITGIKGFPALPEGQGEDEKIYIKLAHYGFSQKNIQMLLETCGSMDELARRLEYGEKRAKMDIEKGKKVTSISGYLRMAIEENWLQTKEDEEEVKERELKAAKKEKALKFKIVEDIKPRRSIEEIKKEKPWLSGIASHVEKIDEQEQKQVKTMKDQLEEHGQTRLFVDEKSKENESIFNNEDEKKAFRSEFARVMQSDCSNEEKLDKILSMEGDDETGNLLKILSLLIETSGTVNKYGHREIKL